MPQRESVESRNARARPSGTIATATPRSSAQPCRAERPCMSVPGWRGLGARRAPLDLAARFGDVALDLRDQLIEAAEALFVAQAADQMQSQLFAVEILVEVEQVHFDAEAGGDRRAHPDVGHAGAEHARALG